MKPKSERRVVFHRDLIEDLRFWVRTDRNVAIRTLDLIEAVILDPFQGVGKPEPLRHELAGFWSRRITQEHRLIYRDGEDKIEFVQARYHY